MLKRFLPALMFLSLTLPVLGQDLKDLRKEIAGAVAQATHQSEEQVLKDYNQSITVVGSVTNTEGVYLTFRLGNRLYVGKYVSFSSKLSMPEPKTVVIGKFYGGGKGIEIPLPDADSGKIRKERFFTVRTESVVN
jgi:hypothetical protein